MLGLLNPLVLGTLKYTEPRSDIMRFLLLSLPSWFNELSLLGNSFRSLEPRILKNLNDLMTSLRVFLRSFSFVDRVKSAGWIVF